MFRKLPAIGSVVVLWSVLSGCESPVPVTAPEQGKATADTPDGMPPPRVASPDGRNWYYEGRVGAVGPDWIELGPGWQGYAPTRPGPDTSKPKRLDAAGTKLGGDPRGSAWPTTHYVSHVQVGDRVEVDTRSDRNDENQFVIRIQIRRRPGGLIPPMIAESTPATANTEHLRDQAEQDWEEKGIPIPKQYVDPEGRTPWTNPPYPPEAPAPRPAAAKP